jgi:hypothetical protein
VSPQLARPTAPTIPHIKNPLRKQDRSLIDSVSRFSNRDIHTDKKAGTVSSPLHSPYITHTNKDEAISPDDTTENIQREIGYILFCAKCQAENARPISFFMKGHQIRRQL